MAHLKVQDVIKATASHFNIPVEDLINREMRSYKMTEIRHIAQYLSRKMTYYSYVQIGKVFKVNHSSVLYGFNRTVHKMLNGQAIRKDVEALKALLEKGH